MVGIKDLLGKLDQYRNNPDLLKKQGSSARERVVNVFSKETMVKNHEKLYLDLLNAG